MVAAKVAEIVIMGGDYPTGSGEFNLAGDPASAAYVFAHSPVAIICTVASLGASIMVRPPGGLNVRPTLLLSRYHWKGKPGQAVTIRSPFTTPSCGGGSESQNVR